MSSRHARLEDVILDELFPEADLALRRGKHIDREEADLYAFISDAQDHLETLYRRYGCELVHKAEGYFYLLPTTEKLGRRFLSPADMLVGQALTLLYLDPKTLEAGGTVTREQLLGHLAGIMGSDVFVRAVTAKRKKHDQRVAEENARAKVAESTRRLASLGFVDLVDDNAIRLRPALMRFADPVRGTAAPEANLEKLVAQGEVILTDTDAPKGATDDEGEEDGAHGVDEREPAEPPAEEPPAEEPPAEEPPPPAEEPPAPDLPVELPVEEPPAEEPPPPAEEPPAPEEEPPPPGENP